jgi:hypothetical protein
MFKTNEKGVIIMADKLRRTKDLITRTVERFKETTTVDYAKYFEGSPTYVTYYQLDAIATQQDTALENVHSLLGNSSPNKYKKIEDVVIYGVDALSISDEISEKGLQSLIAGDFVLLPDSIRPYPGDFFTFDEENLREHLFRINDVQYDRASPKKFFRSLFSLYPENNELIFGNVIDDYVLNYENIGGQETGVIKKSDAAVADKVKLLADSMTDRFLNLFYDEDMDTFSCPAETNGNLVYYWCPYLHKFVHDTQVLTKYERDFMKEIYVNNIDESTNKDIFNDFAYFNSIFRKVQIQEPLSFTDSFMTSLSYDLKSTKNLPFFFARNGYKSLGVYRNEASYLDSFHLLYQNPNETFLLYPEELKFAEGSEIDPSGFTDGTIFFEVRQLSASLIPTSIYRMFGAEPLSIGFNENSEIPEQLLYNIVLSYIADGKTHSGTISNASLSAGVYTYNLVGNFSLLKGLELEKVSGAGVFGRDTYIHSISTAENGVQTLVLKSVSAPTTGLISFKSRFNITEDLLLSINNYYVGQNIKTYILMPLVMYILKQKIKTT